MYRSYIYLTLLIYLVTIFTLSSQNIFNVKDFNVMGNGHSDDWENIQRLVDHISNNGGGTLYFPAGTYLIKDKTILIWGENINMVGESAEEVIFLKTGRAGWWGELLAISGKYMHGRYYGSFGNSDYKKYIVYNHKCIPANNIVVKNITFKTDKVNSDFANNVGVFNSRNVHFYNCIFKDSSQSNLAIVNNTLYGLNENIIIDSCLFKNSGAHNVRVISYNQGDYLGNSVTIKNSFFENVLKEDTHQPEIKSNKVHLWYRAGLGNEKISLLVENCSFDNTGILKGTVNVSNLTIVNSFISSQIILNSSEKTFNSNVSIQNNQFCVNKFPSIEIKGVNGIIIKNNRPEDKANLYIIRNKGIVRQPLIN